MAGQSGGSGGKLDLNRASKEELMGIRGVGEETARKIIDYRDQHGGINSWDDLDEISDIDGTMVEKIKAGASVGSGRR